MNLTSPTVVRQLLEKHKFYFSKSLGQNFLIDNNYVQKIVSGAEIEPTDTVVEIGPGFGTLTRVIATKAKRVLAVEIDKKVLPVLAETLADFPNAKVINQDALKVNFDQLIQMEGHPMEPYKVVANLPYYITTPILMHLLENKFNIATMVLMVQKEVANRMLAKPGGKEYGALSIAIQYRAKGDIVTQVPKEVFMPKPKVDSTVIRLRIYNKPPVEVGDEKVFFVLVKSAFGQRRKTLLNALTASALPLDKEKWRDILLTVGIEPERRGETLSISDFATITHAVLQILK